jgi:hypothetical protein
MKLVKETDRLLAYLCNLTRNISQESKDYYYGTYSPHREFVVLFQYLSSFVSAVLLSNVCCVSSVWYVCCLLWRSLVFRLRWIFSRVCSELSVLYARNSFVMWRFTAFSRRYIFYTFVLIAFLPVRVVYLLFCVAQEIFNIVCSVFCTSPVVSSTVSCVL